MLLLLRSSSLPLSHVPTSFIPIHSFFLTGGDPHSGDRNFGDGEGEGEGDGEREGEGEEEGDGDLGVRDLKGDFLSWIRPTAVFRALTRGH